MNQYKFIIITISLLFFCSIKAEEWVVVEVGDFQKLKITSNLEVVYKNEADSAGFARYLADDKNENRFNFINKGKGTLRIQDADTQWDNQKPTILYVYSNFLTSVESSSNLSVTIEKLSPCASFSINLIGNGSIIAEDVKCTNLSASITTGNGNIVVSGSCVDATLKMLGTGTISADRLQAENVKCNILGTGVIGCWPIDNLNVKGLGTTKIYYKGKPNIKKMGGGKLFELSTTKEENQTNEGVKVESLQPQ